MKQEQVIDGQSSTFIAEFYLDNSGSSTIGPPRACDAMAEALAFAMSTSVALMAVVEVALAAWVPLAPPGIF